MSYSGIDQRQLVERRPSGLDNLAKRAVLKVLSQLQKGRLVVEEEGRVQVFGEPAAQAPVTAKIVVHHPSAYRDVLFNGTIGSGEAYMLGYWSTPDLLSVIRLMVINMAVIQQMDANPSLFNRLSHGLMRIVNANTKRGSRKNIGAHYDLGNDFFQLFLDREMMYSSAIYPQPDADLQTAANYKLQRVCEKLALKPTDHLLEIGTGWGGMAIYAAKHYGCQVTTTTISREQYDYARQRVAQEGLDHKVSVLLEDYRDLGGQYDKLVSIEMIEAVGHRFYKTYFAQCNRLLKQEGLMLIQAITIPDQRYEQAKRAVDFIQKYIFPGGCLPSIGVIAQHLGNYTNMQMVALEDITLDYAKTLAHWRQRFLGQLSEVREQGYSEQFIRMWDFYLCYCEGGFRERVIGTAQLLFAKPGAEISTNAIKV